MSSSILLIILATSIATYLSRFLGVLSSEKIKESSKIFRWFNCLAYSTLAALITRMMIFPVGTLSEADYLSRAIVILICLTIYFASKKNTSKDSFYAAGGKISGFQNGLAIAGDYMSAASFLGISGLVFFSINMMRHFIVVE